jgi:hypothetical protein
MTDIFKKDTFLKFNSEDNRIEQIIDVDNETLFTKKSNDKVVKYKEKDIRVKIYNGLCTLHKNYPV